MQQNNAQFFIIPDVEDGKGRIRIFLSEHSGRTKTLFEGKDFTSQNLRWVERQFRKAAEELEAEERHREFTASAKKAVA
jgi:hypothetical protein